MGAIIGARWVNIKRIEVESCCSRITVDDGNAQLTLVGTPEAVRGHAWAPHLCCLPVHRPLLLLLSQMSPPLRLLDLPWRCRDVRR